MTVKIGLIGDLHLSDKPPSNCTDAYNDQLFAMLDEVVKIAADRVLDAVAFAGDLFHIKRPSATSHGTVQRMIEVVQAFDCPVYLVVGNHDILHDRVDSIHETQPFGVLLRSGARLLDGWAPDLPLYGVPWQQRWNEGAPAFDAWCSGDGMHDAEGSLVVTHAPLYPPGEELPWENIPASVVAAWMRNVGHLYYGHVHDFHGVFTCDGVVFCNQGALSRGSLHESDLTRRPAMTIWHSEVDGPAAFERVELQSAPPASEVFRLEEAGVRIDYRDRMAAFLGALSDSTVTATSVEAVVAHVQSMPGLSDPERVLAAEVLNEAATGGLS